MRGKNRYKKLISDVRFVLINNWDPISIGTNPNLADEYDAYIGQVIRMLSRGCSVIELPTFLQRIEDKEIGCKTDSITVHKVATKLKEIFICANQDLMPQSNSEADRM
jgi:hypothetical protein